VTVVAALNGGRLGEAVPRTPEELAVEAVAAVGAGADVLHLHPFDDDGRETLEAEPSAAAIRAVRAAVGPHVPLSLTTASAIEPDPERRAALVSGWYELPDLVTANQGEDGIVELCEDLLARGIGIEAGLLSARDAELFLASGLAPRSARALVEPVLPDEAEALALADEIEAVLRADGTPVEQVHHGANSAIWAVIRRAIPLGHGVRTGIEDTVVLPDGTTVTSNAELVAEVHRMLGPPQAEASGGNRGGRFSR
jgi:uncharacterized protein (DUF849 family)